MKRISLLVMFLLVAFAFARPLLAEDQDAVDLSDISDDTVQSPSLDNATPAGQAPGGPVSDADNPDNYNDTPAPDYSSPDSTAKS